MKISRIKVPRELLLVEVERRCADPACNTRVRIGLTKAEARAYTGFACERCELWNEDVLSERDIPEWWEELKVMSLEALRPMADLDGASEDEDNAISRLSDAWRIVRERQGSVKTEDSDKGEDSS